MNKIFYKRILFFKQVPRRIYTRRNQRLWAERTLRQRYTPDNISGRTDMTNKNNNFLN